MAEANGAAAGAANGAAGGAGGGANGAVVNGAANGAGAGAANGSGGEARHTSLVDALGVNGSGAANGQGDGAANGANGQQPGVGHNGGPPFYPENLPADYRGASDRETIEKLAKDVGLVRRAPEKPEAYTLKLDGELAKRYGEIDKDPVLPLVRKAAHAAGLDNAQFQTMFQGLYKELRDGGLLEEPIDVEAEVKLLAPKAADPATAKAQAGARLNSIFQGVKALEARGVVTKKGATALQAAAATAEGAIALEAVLRMTGEQGVQTGGVSGAAGVETREQVMEQMKDPRYSTTSPKHDPAFRKDIDERIRRAQPARR